MWTEHLVPKSIGCAWVSQRSQFDKSVVDAQGQWLTVNDQRSVNDQCTTVTHPDIFAFKVIKVAPKPKVDFLIFCKIVTPTFVRICHTDKQVET